MTRILCFVVLMVGMMGCLAEGPASFRATDEQGNKWNCRYSENLGPSFNTDRAHCERIVEPAR